jgi:hypothetical protein
MPDRNAWANLHLLGKPNTFLTAAVPGEKGLDLSFLCLITPLCFYLHGGVYGGLYERAHMTMYFPPLKHCGGPKARRASTA